jgi:hypothetical protein
MAYRLREVGPVGVGLLTRCIYSAVQHTRLFGLIFSAYDTPQCTFVYTRASVKRARKMIFYFHHYRNKIDASILVAIRANELSYSN